jgi:hypothetical protein
MRDKLDPDGLAFRTELALLSDDFTSTPDAAVHRDDCYICTDPEYAQMGLPLCYACRVCNGHVPADGNRCDDCGVIQDDCGPFDPEAAELAWALFGWLWAIGGRSELDTWAPDEMRIANVDNDELKELWL